MVHPLQEQQHTCVQELACGLARILARRRRHPAAETEAMRLSTSSEELDGERLRLKECQKIARLGHWTYDLITNEVFWSDETFRLWSFDPTKDQANYENFLASVHPEDRQMVNDAWKSSLETKEPYDIIHRLLYKDGTVKYVNNIGKTEFDPGTGVPVYSRGTTQDITELQKAHEELRVAKEQAETSDRLKSAFLANMR